MKSCGIRLVLLILFFSSQLLFSASAAPARPVGQSTRHAPAALISQGLAFAGHLGGTPGAIATQGAYVYAGLGRELAIIDIANPAAPVRVGYLILPARIQKLVIGGSYLYIAAGGLYVLNLASPTAPAIVGSLDVPGEATDLAIAGAHAYVTSRGVLSAIDIATPALPATIGVYTSSADIDRVAITGHYAYLRWVACNENNCSSNLEIVDIAAPAHPTFVTRDYSLFSGIEDIAFAGSYGYIARGNGGLDVIDVSDQTHPATVGHAAVNATKISIVDSRAYVADTDQLAGGLRIFDISVPANLVQQGFYAPPGVIAAVAGSGRYVYFFDVQEGFGILDLLNPAVPARTGGLGELIHPGQLVMRNSYAYVVEQPLVGDQWKQQPNGLKIVDISDRMHASVVGVYRPAGMRIDTITIAGNYAYIGTKTDVLTETGTLNIVNVADPTHPVEVAVYKIPGATWIAMGPIVILDHYAYVGDHTKVHVVDVADPAHPQLVGSYTPAQGQINCIAGQNGQIYLGLGDGTLEIIDVSNPAAPTKAGAIATQYYAIDIAVAGQYAYLVSGLDSDAGALYAIDISNPSHPTQASQIRLRTTGRIAATQGIAYITNPEIGTGGVQVIDTTDPFHLSEALYYSTGTGADVAVSGAFVYVTAADNGLFILEALTLTPRIFVPLME